MKLICTKANFCTSKSFRQLRDLTGQTVTKNLKKAVDEIKKNIDINIYYFDGLRQLQMNKKNLKMMKKEDGFEDYGNWLGVNNLSIGTN
ncbi:unnamed protein product [Caenorhabditis angaria]|uniref:Uncharacterized protein n=1 Tax=Caenorhabditis angaria TaxID=860376 RepID=A0A9P1J152_9PELO|nr:unnamed protein product [Caenorhabditis angaria]